MFSASTYYNYVFFTSQLEYLTEVGLLQYSRYEYLSFSTSLSYQYTDT